MDWCCRKLRMIEEQRKWAEMAEIVKVKIDGEKGETGRKKECGKEREV